MTSEACSFPCLLPSLLGAGKPLLCYAALGIGPSLPFLPALCQVRVLGCTQVPVAPRVLGSEACFVLLRFSLPACITPLIAAIYSNK